MRPGQRGGRDWLKGMRSRLLVSASPSSSLIAFTLLSCAVAAAACSSAGASGANGSSGGDPADEDGGSSGSSGSSGGGGTKTAAWSPVTLPSGVKASRVAGDRRGIWLVEAHGTASVGVGRISAADTYERVYEKVSSPGVLSNYTVAALAPIDDKTAIITGEWFTLIIGDGETALGSTTSYGTSAFARSRSDIWFGSRVGTLRHVTSASSSDSSTVDIGDAPGIAALWGVPSMMFLASGSGIRAVPRPLPSDWSGDARIVARGEFKAMKGLDDKAVAYAVGKDGAVARYDGAKGWSAMNAGTNDTLYDVAVASDTDVWATSGEALFHFDGAAWTRASGEAGLPAKASSIAAQPDGTLWAVAEDALYRRSPGKVKGATTDGGVVTSDAGTGVCAFGEPNEDFADAYPISLPASFDACAPMNDSDRFTAVTPSGNKAGGFLKVTVDDADSVELLGALEDMGGTSNQEVWSGRSLNLGSTTSLVGYAAAASQRRYNLFVGGALRTGAARYHASITYTPFDDTFEPNDVFGDAKTITAGTPAHAIFPTYIPTYNPAGANGKADDADWYLAAHGAGAFTISLTDVSPDVQAQMDAYFVPAGSSSMGSTLSGATGTAKGAPVTLTGTLPSAGSIRIVVKGRAAIVKGAASAPPGFVQKYSLLVSN